MSFGGTQTCSRRALLAGGCRLGSVPGPPPLATVHGRPGPHSSPGSCVDSLAALRWAALSMGGHLCFSKHRIRTIEIPVECLCRLSYLAQYG